MNRYCLADYILTVDIPVDIGFGTQSVSIGGEGSYTDEIVADLNAELFSTQGDNTGSWVHIKNLNKTGNVAISVKQISDKVAIFKTIVNLYSKVSSSADGLTLTLRDTANNTVFIATDCLIKKIPSQSFSGEPNSQRWEFTCGSIDFI